MEKPEFYRDSLYERLMRNKEVLAALEEINYKLRYAISREMTYINYANNNNVRLMEQVVFVLKYMGFNVYDNHVYDENFSYIIIYL